MAARRLPKVDFWCDPPVLEGRWVRGEDRRTARHYATVDFPVHEAIGCALSADHRLAVYGSDAARILRYEAEPSGAEGVHPLLDYSVAEVRWHVRHKMAMIVEDVLSRRTRSLPLEAWSRRQPWDDHNSTMIHRRTEAEPSSNQLRTSYEPGTKRSRDRHGSTMDRG